MSNDPESAADDANEPPQVGLQSKWLLLAVVIVGAGLLYWQFGDKLSLDYLATKEAELREFQQRQPVLVYGIAFGVYVAVTGLSLPGAAAMTLLVGWYFGFVRGLVLVSFASTAGATIAFLLSRYFFRDTVQRKFGEKLDAFNKALQRDGAFYLLSLRLIPAVPFFVINAVMGLTPIRVWTFWWVSQLGMLAGTMVYVYAGSSVPDLMTLSTEGASAVFSAKQLTQITIAFALLGAFPIAVKLLMNKFAPQNIQNEEPI